jgi:hypothetical protein
MISNRRAPSHNDLRLLGRVEFKPARADRHARLHRGLDRVVERRLPRHQVLRLDGNILLHARIRDALPCARVRGERAAEPVVPARHAAQRSRRSRRGAAERVRERLVLRLAGGRRGRGRGQVRPFQVRGGEVLRGASAARAQVGAGADLDAATHRGRKVLDGFGDLGRVVVRLGFVHSRDPARGDQRRGGCAGRGCALQERDMDVSESVDARLEVLVLCAAR